MFEEVDSLNNTSKEMPMDLTNKSSISPDPFITLEK
jgi:hypothetical protein